MRAMKHRLLFSIFLSFSALASSRAANVENFDEEAEFANREFNNEDISEVGARMVGNKLEGKKIDPFFVLVKVKHPWDDELCGGVIIADKLVLTNAFCVVNELSVEAKEVEKKDVTVVFEAGKAEVGVDKIELSPPPLEELKQSDVAGYRLAVLTLKQNIPSHAKKISLCPEKEAGDEEMWLGGIQAATGSNPPYTEGAVHVKKDPCPDEYNKKWPHFFCTDPVGSKTAFSIDPGSPIVDDDKKGGFCLKAINSPYDAPEEKDATNYVIDLTKGKSRAFVAQKMSNLGAARKLSPKRSPTTPMPSNSGTKSQPKPVPSQHKKRQTPPKKDSYTKTASPPRNRKRQPQSLQVPTQSSPKPEAYPKRAPQVDPTPKTTPTQRPRPDHLNLPG